MTYTATVGTDVAAATGARLAAPHVWSFTTTAAVDVLLLVDLSGSYSPELSALQGSIEGILASIRATHPDTNFGVAVHSDFPQAPYGASTDVAYELRQGLTSSTAAVVFTFAGLSTLGGGDTPGSQLEAVYQSATGPGLSPFAGYEILPGDPGWRPTAVRTVVLLTDSPLHDPVDYAFGGTHGDMDAADALLAAGVHLLCVYSDTDPAVLARLDDLATATWGQARQTVDPGAEIVSALDDLLDG